ncbi:hypothetical protein [Corynebacterium caspium]|uniref:hypothetical protein n=1 Tax=Corynebacterium caspium TaxID=234828 RepID=UPI0003813B8A|nr:hypothetical protein [Corynebacterium caspium]WKD59663.1 hypothetical protein CCASP_06400 [Corynebacterium caspium DSM 44850]
MTNHEQQWYYYLKTGEVAQGPTRSWESRMGPYPSKAAAEAALEIVKARNEAAAEQEQQWEE